MNTPRIHDKIEWALTKEAQDTVALMEQAGFDRDLAISVLEQLWSEDAVYELDEDGCG